MLNNQPLSFAYHSHLAIKWHFWLKHNLIKNYMSPMGHELNLTGF